MKPIVELLARRGTWALPLLLLSLTANPSPLLGQTDNFNDNLDDGWGHYNPLQAGTYTLVDGTYRLRTPPSPNPTMFGPGRAGATRPEFYSDFYITVDVLSWNDTVNQAFGILARLSNVGPSSTRGYAFTYNRGTGPTAGDMEMSTITGEAPTGITVSGEDSIHLVPGTSYRFVFIGRGTALEGRVYQLPNVETPVIQMIASNGAYQSGTNGLVVFDISGNSVTDATFDNYFATAQEPPKLNIRRGPFEDIIVSFSTNYPAWRLQSSTNLSVSPIPWINVPAEQVLPFSDMFEYAEDPTEPRKYFRLIQD